MSEYVEKETMLKKLDQEGCDCELIKTLLDFPAVDVTPVVRAQWVQGKGNSWTCSHCGAGTAAAPGCTPIESDCEFFCYHCGADMRRRPNEKTDD